MTGKGAVAIIGATAVFLGVAVAPIVLTGAITAQCQATSQPGTGAYVNPFRVGQWLPSRTDEGVDWVPVVLSPVIAIGDGVITYSATTGTGWPGGAFVAYLLTDGPAAGHFIYVAEHLTRLAPLGTRVAAGQVLAVALPGSPWTEWGWAAPSGPMPAVAYNGAADGSPTEGGQAFARFLETLGAKPLDDPGPGSVLPDRVTAPACPDMASVDLAGGSSITTPADFATAVLAGLGIAPTFGNVAAVVAWEMAEGGWPHNNPLNTTLPEPGATDLAGNSAHVKVYPSMAVGVTATVSVLAEQTYAAVVAALSGADPYAVARAVAASSWGTSDFSAAIGLPYSPQPAG